MDSATKDQTEHALRLPQSAIGGDIRRRRKDGSICTGPPSGELSTADAHEITK